MNRAVKFFFQQKKLSIFLLSLSLIWFLTFYRGLLAAVDVWWTSEIYHHCFLVLPISVWLIYLKRDDLIKTEKNINYLALPLIVFLLLLQVFGVAGDIKLFQYVATFAIIPCLVLFFIGLKGSLTILFPLFFLIFAIPVGDELIPILQNITADLSVFFLNFTPITIFREGLYIEIPNGKFVVAEACSGISFLIVSLVFGSLYSYLYMKSPAKKAVFVGLSIAVPIIANALRVMGIVIIGDVWGMEYAGGTDHLIYGGVFYCFVLFLLIMIGEKIKDKDITHTKQFTYSQLHFSKPTSIKAGLIILLFLGCFTWQNKILYPSIERVNHSLPKTLVNQISRGKISTNPSFEGYSRKIEGQLISSKDVEVIVTWFDYGSKGDAFSLNQKHYDETRWRLAKTTYLPFTDDFGDGQYKEQVLVNRFGQRFKFNSLYIINDRVFGNKQKANLYYAWLTFTQQQPTVLSLSTLTPFSSEQKFANSFNTLLRNLQG